MLENLIHKSEVAEMLGIHEITVIKMAKKGKLPGIIIGAKWFFDKEQIKEWLADKMKKNLKENDR